MKDLIDALDDQPAFDPDIDDGLHLLPLGGSEEIGMNLYLYACDGKWLMVDCGIAFGDDGTPGIDVLMPDPEFIEERREDLVGIVLTHGHEDHFGAIEYLWSRLRRPVYATPFTAALLRLKLAESNLKEPVQIIEVPLGGHLDLGPFAIDFISVTHSIPEPNALVIRTRHGTVVHSGDWKLDPAPQVGALTDEDALRALGEEGVTALICDSTNALVPGHSGSEGTVREALADILIQQPQRVAVTCFASNVARMNSIAHAAHVAGRHCALVGRSLWRVHEAARQTGYLDLPERFLNEEEAADIPRDKLVLICTGSQGEPRSALARISRGDHNHIVLERGDTVIFSAREIPGNEKAIRRVQDDLVRLGATIITADDAPVHVSGHPARDEMVRYYQWLRPQISVPVHGTARHLAAHAEIAHACQVPEVVIPHDGALIRLSAGQAGIRDAIDVHRLGLDGNRLISLSSTALRNRQRMTQDGAVVATIVVDRHAALAHDPQITLLGIEDRDLLEETEDALADEIESALGRIAKPDRKDDEAVAEAARLAVRRALRRWNGKRPLIEIHLVRV